MLFNEQSCLLNYWDSIGKDFENSKIKYESTEQDQNMSRTNSLTSYRK
jgi:hypothetical protein